MEGERGIVDWLFCTFEENPNGILKNSVVYKRYLQDIGEHVENEKPVSKMKLWKIIHKVFLHGSNMKTEKQNGRHYRGFYWKQVNTVNDLPLRINNIVGFSGISASQFFVLPSSSTTNLVVGYHHKERVNNIPVLTQLIVNENGRVQITTLGKEIDLKSVHIGTKIRLTHTMILGHLSAVKNLIFCKGFPTNYSRCNNVVIKETWTPPEAVVYRSVKCARVISPLSTPSACLPCRRQHRDLKHYLVKTTCVPTDPIVTVESIQTPPTLKLASDEISYLLDRLFPGLEDKTSNLQILLHSQIDNMYRTDNRNHRWHPKLIELCAHLLERGAKAYRDLSKEGLLTLPTVRLLRYYKNGKPGRKKKLRLMKSIDLDPAK